MTVSDCMRLERAQNRAARLITGTPLRTLMDRLWRELGWTSLTGRQKMHRLQFYHILLFDVRTPMFLKSILPNTRQHSSQKMLCNASDKTIPIVRTSIYHRSKIPSTTRIWNALPEQTCTNFSHATFKRHLIELLAILSPPTYFFLGSLITNTLHVKLRLNVSKVNYHIYSIQKSDSLSCSSGHYSENTKHFMLICPLYHAQRKPFSWLHLLPLILTFPLFLPLCNLTY